MYKHRVAYAMYKLCHIWHNLYIAYFIRFLSQCIITIYYYYYDYYLISICKFIIITFSYLQPPGFDDDKNVLYMYTGCVCIYIYIYIIYTYIYMYVYIYIYIYIYIHTYNIYDYILYMTTYCI